MSSSSISSLQFEGNNFNYIAMMFVRIFCYLVIPLGIVGHSMNFYIFTRPTLRTNACARYFFAAAIVGLLQTCYSLPMRMIQSGYVGTDPGAYSAIFCKVTWFCLYSIRSAASWLMVLACADRYLCSCRSMTMRAWSSIRVANRLIPITILLTFVAFIHVPIFLRIYILPTTQKPTCYSLAPPGTYRIILSFFHLIYFGLSPSCCMLAFGLLTLRNIERSKRIAGGQANHVETTATQNNRRTNRQMLRMLFIQVIIYCVTGTAFSVGMIVTSINPYQTKDVLQLAQANMISAVVGMLANIGPCLNFYFFTLSSGMFRKELKKLLYKLTGKYHQLQLDHTQLSLTIRARTQLNSYQ